MSGSPVPSTHDIATSRPPPLACSADTIPHSAHSVTPYEAFSTLQPRTIRPSSTSAAAPTGKREYGAYAPCIASVAAARSDAQSMSMTHPHSIQIPAPRHPSDAPGPPLRSAAARRILPPLRSAAARRILPPMRIAATGAVCPRVNP
jgi:hypothetical protein